MHHIISFLSFRQACRTCVLSKRWAHVSNTNPILRFHYRYLVSKRGFLEAATTKMKRYCKEKLRIREIFLEFPISFETKLDEFLEIAIRNRVEKLVLTRALNYLLPISLFSAKSIKHISCVSVKIPYCDTINLTSLETLILWSTAVEDCMLNDIINSCQSLKTLELLYCTDIESIVIPGCSQLEMLNFYETGGSVILETSSLKYFGFTYTRGLDESWRVKSETGLLINLVSLELKSDTVTDDVFGELLSELISLKTLMLSCCNMLTTIRISGDQLKEIQLDNCDNLVCVRIDAPGLRKFFYRGEYEQAISFDIKSQASCDISLHLPPRKLDTKGFLKLKKLLIGLSRCNVLEISFSRDSQSKLEFEELSWYKCDDIEFDEKPGNTHLAPPCDVKVLMLNFSFWKLSNSSVSAFLDGLLWTCHPDRITLRLHLKAWNVKIKDLICKLQDMAKHRKYPMKRVEVIGANCSDLLELKTLDIQLRLYW